MRALYKGENATVGFISRAFWIATQYLMSNQEPWLTEVMVFFKTKGDNKDADTDLHQSLQYEFEGGWGQIAYAQGWYWEFATGSYVGPLSLALLVSYPPTKRSIPGRTQYQISITPRGGWGTIGSDSWTHVTFELYLTFSDGSQLLYSDTFSLSISSPSYSFNL